MVFDWFQRRSAQPEAPAPESDAAGSQPAVDPIPDAPAAPTPEPDPAPDAPAPTEPAPVVAPEASAEPASTAPEADPAVDDDPLEWARQAYARLKAQQAAQMAAPPEEVAEPPAPAAPAPASQPLATPAVETPPQAGTAEPSPADSAPAPSPPPAAAAPPAAGLSLLEQAAAQRQERQQELDARAIEAPPAAPSPSSTAAPQPTTDAAVDQPQLGEFDDTFTWSAEVLAAQGRRVDQVSLEEIDWLSRLRQGLEKTRQGFVTGLLDNLGDDPLTPEVVDDLEALLLRADAGVVATDQVMEALRQRLNEEVVDPSEGIRFLKEQLRNLLEQPIQASGVELLAPERDRLNIWLMVGVNGVGKTTTLGKLANLAVRSGYSAMIAAADTFRAAAVQQVEVWGERSDVPVVANPTANADPAAVVFDAIGAARSKGTDLLLVDTAGRLQTKHNLMEELQKIRRIVDRLAPESKVESLLVLDASQGQNGLKQAMAFAKAADLTGVVITKLDGTARGGVALAVSSEAGLPIRFIGAGEGIRDLRPFNSFEFVEALLAGR